MMKRNSSFGIVLTLVAAQAGCAASDGPDDENTDASTGGTPSSTAGGAGTSGGSSASAGGTGNSGSTSGGNNGSGGTSAPTCDLIDSALLLADFESGEAKIAEVSGRKGSFYLSDDGTPGGVITPEKLENTPLAAESGGACSSLFGFHVTATGFTDWGALAAVDFVPKAGDVKQPYDASSYTGIAFRAKAAAPASMRVEISDKATAAEGGLCDPEAPSGMMNRCGDHFASVISISGDWAEYQITFATLTQKGWGKNGVSALDASGVYALRFKGESDFDISLDDIRFTQ